MDIRLVKRADIDRNKWNGCVHYANNGDVFGYKWFLDNISKDWAGLVEGDYQSVMPFFWKKNFWGQASIYTPDLIRSLGIYSVHVLSPKRIKLFLEAIPATYKKVNLALNESHNLSKLPGLNVQPQSNTLLLLKDPYEEISEQYKETLISQKLPDGCQMTSSIKPEQIADFYLSHSNDAKSIKKTRSNEMLRIMYNSLHRGVGVGSGIKDAAGNWLAVNFYLLGQGKAISWIPIQSAKGKELGALTFLLDMFIRANAGRPMILDFNGTDPLFEQFGGTKVNYYYVNK